jgi:hypothetical protein
MARKAAIMHRKIMASTPAVMFVASALPVTPQRVAKRSGCL